MSALHVSGLSSTRVHDLASLTIDKFFWLDYYRLLIDHWIITSIPSMNIFFFFDVKFQKNLNKKGILILCQKISSPTLVKKITNIVVDVINDVMFFYWPVHAPGCVSVLCPFLVCRYLFCPLIHMAVGWSSVSWSTVPRSRLCPSWKNFTSTLSSWDRYDFPNLTSRKLWSLCVPLLQ